MKGTFSRLHCRISPTTAPFPTRCGRGQGLIWNRTCRHNTQSAPPTFLVHSLAVPFPYGVHRRGHDVQIPASAISQHQSRHDGCKARHRDNEWKGHCIGRCQCRAAWRLLPRTVCRQAVPYVFWLSADSGQPPADYASTTTDAKRKILAHRFLPQDNIY